MTEDYDVTLRWHPFQLRPDTPEAGMPISAVLPPEYLKQAEARLRQATAEVGLPFKRGDWMPNTHLAHEAAMFAEEHGHGDAFHRAVLRRYFGEGGAIARVDDLVAIGREIGLDADALRDALTSRRYREAVDAELSKAHAVGVHAVPSFVFGDLGG
ncbi:MAG TPA: DsbA family protein, partial [Oscillatoriaceae cyanobacterium]